MAVRVRRHSGSGQDDENAAQQRHLRGHGLLFVAQKGYEIALKISHQSLSRIYACLPICRVYFHASRGLAPAYGIHVLSMPSKVAIN